MQKPLFHRLKIAISGIHGDALDATKPMGKRLPKVEVYIEAPDTAVDDGGGFACAVSILAACGRFLWKCGGECMWRKMRSIVIPSVVKNDRRAGR